MDERVGIINQHNGVGSSLQRKRIPGRDGGNFRIMAIERVFIFGHIPDGDQSNDRRRNDPVVRVQIRDPVKLRIGVIGNHGSVDMFDKIHAGHIAFFEPVGRV
jgi:hypothetical protein